MTPTIALTIYLLIAAVLLFIVCYRADLSNCPVGMAELVANATVGALAWPLILAVVIAVAPIVIIAKTARLLRQHRDNQKQHRRHTTQPNSEGA